MLICEWVSAPTSFDSGSFSLWTVAAKWAAEVDPQTKKRVRPRATVADYYNTKAFWAYMDRYAAFIKEHAHAIDYYANVDVIPDPVLTFRNQRYLEKEHGLSPVPVVHYRTDLFWLEKYLVRKAVGGAHGLVALGGLVGSTAQDACRHWLDRAFDVICGQPSRLPRTRIHGFGVTSFPLLYRYPWWSVDSTTWTMVGAMGGVIVPHHRDGKFVFTVPPYVMKFSSKAKDKTLAGRHFNTMRAGERATVLAWLAEIGIPLGECHQDGTVISYGVTNRHCERKAANLLFFEKMRLALPKYPWPFMGVKKTQLDIKL